MVDEKGNVNSFKQRIDAADTLPKLAQLETSLDRLYTAGVFSVTMYKRLDGAIFRKTAELSQ